MSEFILTKEILALSEAEGWATAKMEWKLRDVYREDTPETCLCGHYPILEICVLRNESNGNEAVVGNCCVRKFMGIPSHLIFQGIKRIKDDVELALNPAAIEHAVSKRWINDWEETFLLNTSRKRVLSGRQLDTRININTRVLGKVINVRKVRPKLA